MAKVSYSFCEVYNLQHGEQSKMFQARLNSAGTINTEILCKLISQRSSISSADVKATLDSLNFFFDFFLSQGHRIQLDDLGIFSLRLRSMRNPEKENVPEVKISGIHFLPSVKMKDQLKLFQLQYKPQKERKEYPEEERLKRIIAYVNENHFIDLKTCTSLNKTSGYKARNDLQFLIEEGKLEAVGYTNNRVYIKCHPL